MNNEHLISDQVLDIANVASSKAEQWMAYNKSLYFIDKNDVYFFINENDAKEFANHNISDEDSFNVLRFDSVSDILKGIPYRYELSKQIDNGLSNSKDKQLSLFNSQSKTNVMNNENFQYLSDNIKYMGFGESLKADLEKNLNEGKAEFQLQYRAEMNKKPFEATLNFRKSDNSDMYFFNSYGASLQRSNSEKVDQTFYLNKGKGVTAKEAFNLLDGRSVQKDLTNRDNVPYKAWVQLDFDNKDKANNFEIKQFHENYGYDPKKALEKFTITDLKDPEKEKALMQSLQKGNLQSVTIEKDGTATKMFVEANPQFKTVTLYDSQMKRVEKEALGQYQAIKQSPAKEIKQEQKQEVKQDLKQDSKKSVKQLPTDELDDSKKKSTRKKGMSV